MKELVIDDAFVAEYDKWILKSIMRMGAKGETVDDIKGLVYERLLDHNNYDKSKGKVTTWINSVSRSVVSNELKKRQRSKDVYDQRDRVSIDTAQAYIGPEDAGEAREEIRRILRTVVASTRDKTLFLKVHLHGYQHREIAEEYDMSEAAVSKVVSRVMQLTKEEATKEHQPNNWRSE